MPSRVNEAEPSEVVRVRVSESLRTKCAAARERGAHAGDAESSFLGYLLAVGLAKYEKAILPHETSEDEGLPNEARRAAAGE